MLLNETISNIFRWAGLIGLSGAILIKISTTYVVMFFFMFLAIMLNLIIFSRY